VDEIFCEKVNLEKFPQSLKICSKIGGKSEIGGKSDRGEMHHCLRGDGRPLSVCQSGVSTTVNIYGVYSNCN